MRVILSFCFLVYSASASISAKVLAPAMIFSYSDEFNQDCGISVEPKWISEAKSKEPFFASLWEAESPALFSFFFSRFSDPFPTNAYEAKLSACPTTISYSRPLVLNISRFLKSYIGAGVINPDYAFLVLAFHELMHNWIEGNLNDSPLLRKYKNETREVKVHLHLMAIEQFVYKGTNRSDLLGWIERKYPSIGGDYARAWQIVNREGAEAFLLELH